VGVLVLILVAVLVGAFVIYWRPSEPRGPPVLVIRATDTVRATPSTVLVAANLGPHCARSFWNEAEHTLSVHADVDLATAEGLLHEEFVRATDNLAWGGGDATNTTVFRTASGLRFVSAADNRTLETFTILDTNVTANGTTYGPGTSWTAHFEYDVATPGGTARVVEDIVFRNEGILRPHIVPVAACA
jgi:hypothetical protein